MSPEEAASLLKSLAPVCKAEGVRRIKVGDLEIEFGGGGVDPEEAKAFQGMLDSSMPTDEDALNYSTPGYVPS